MIGPGEATALNWGEESPWCLLRMRLLRTGTSTPPSLGEILPQALFHGRPLGGQSGSGRRKEALGRALREEAGLGFQWLVFVPDSEPSWTCVYLYRQYTFIGACCTSVLSERLKGDADLALEKGAHMLTLTRDTTVSPTSLAFLQPLARL